MDKDRLRKLTDNPKFIPGIYNYCDRWCERCIFTSRCLNYALDEETFNSPDEPHNETTEFWDKLRETFSITTEIIKENTEEDDFDFDAAQISDELDKENDNHLKAKNHICSITAEYYSRKVKEWFNNSNEIFNKQQSQLRSKIESNPVEAIREASVVKDSIEIINWHQNQIYIKILRALHSKLDEEELNEALVKDSDGSAKVALIGIDRSIAAWGEMLHFFSVVESEIFAFILQLDDLRKEIERTFPKARNFIRPGFDELN